MRKLLTTVSAIALAGGLAYTVARSASPSTLPFFSGPACEESSQTQACFNALISQIYTGVTGNFAYTGGPVGNTGTGTTTQNFVFASATIPTGTVLAASSGYRARCAGISAIATAFKVGIAVGRSIAISQENFPVGGAQPNNPNWDLELEFRTAINQTTATPNYTWMGRGFAAVPTGTVSGATLSLASGNDTTVTDNTVNFGVPINCVMYGGATTGEVTMLNFSVEQLR